MSTQARDRTSTDCRRPSAAPATTAPPSRSAWRISASAPSTAATRPSTPTICSNAASTAGASSASTSATRGSAGTLGAAGRPLHAADPEGRPRRGAGDRQHRPRRRQPGRARSRRSTCWPSPDIDVVTMTVTEKGYCHRPATGELTLDHPDIVHDLADPEAPRSVPGLIVRALDLRRRTPRPSADADELRQHSRRTARSSPASSARWPSAAATVSRDWIAANAAFPSSMVDRIAPATAPADFATVEAASATATHAVVVGEPFRQWVIEDRFAGRLPAWDLVGATFVDDVTPFEHLKMRVLNGAQSTLCLSRRARRPRAHLRRHRRPAARGLRAPHARRGDAADARSRCRASTPERLCRAEPRPAAQHRDPPPQPPDRHRRLAEDRPAPAEPDRRAAAARAERARCLPSPVAGWMAYLIRAVDALRRCLDRGRSLWRPDRRRSPTGSATTRRRWPTRSSAIDTIFDPELAASAVVPPRDRRAGSTACSARSAGLCPDASASRRRGRSNRALQTG